MLPRVFFTISLLFLLCLAVNGQSDAERLIDQLLGETPLEEDLRELCDEIGGRVTGSKANEEAVDWALQKLQDAGIHAVKDPFEMPVLWLPGSTSCQVNGLDFSPEIVAKYNCPPGHYEMPLLYVGMGSAEELDQYSAEALESSFILVETDLCVDINGLFQEYDHTTRVELEAEKRNIQGIIFMSSRPNKLLYRYVTYKGTNPTTPQFVMARIDAMRCIRALKEGEELSVTLDVKATTGPSFTSHNVIAEITGSEKPEEIIVIGSHIDSWALGTGANDNGCNVSMMMDIARQMQALGIKPKRTIRFALWNGEEQGFNGSLDYTLDHLDDLDNHLMALSIDIGSGALSGFFTNGREELIPVVDEVLKPVGHLGEYTQVNVPIVGTDNFDFMLQGVPNLVGNHLAQLYGPNYHAASDTYDKVDLKQLKINSAIVGTLALGFANLDDQSAERLFRQNRAEIEKLIQDFNIEFSMRIMNVWEPWANRKRGRLD